MPKMENKGKKILTTAITATTLMASVSGKSIATEEPTEPDSALVKEIDTSDLALKGTQSNAFVGSYRIKSDDNAIFNVEDGIIKLSQGSLTITGEGTECFELTGNSTLVLDEVTINSTKQAGITIKAGHTGTVTLNGKNEINGPSGYAAIEVEHTGSGNGASENGNLVINGTGTLSAVGGSNSAGIGGSGAKLGLYGKILITSGTINSTGNGGAGIGGGCHTGSGGSYKTEAQIGEIKINGGVITAIGNGGGAGIGGGNHTDSGDIIIAGGTIVLAKGHGGGAGIGGGIGSTKAESGTKGPGYYYTNIEIKGGTIKEAVSDWLGAGIGGGYCGDATVKISGGKIISTTGGKGNTGSNYQGGAGIGAGYQGLAKIIITGGTIENAKGGTASAGIGQGAVATSSKRAGETTISFEEQEINISGGTFVNIEGGEGGGAGIGSGNGVDKCTINISGGTFEKVTGGNAGTTAGAAGIGSGVGTSNGVVTKYVADTDLDISITGGTFNAVIGGSGAAGIGSGAGNETANTVKIDAKNSSIKSYSDGTKYAIENGTSYNLVGSILQATISDLVDATKGITAINLEDSQDTYNIELPEGYNTFGLTVTDSRGYAIKTEDKYVSTKTTKDTTIPEGSNTNPEIPTHMSNIENITFLYPVDEIPNIQDPTNVAPQVTEEPKEEVIKEPVEETKVEENKLKTEEVSLTVANPKTSDNVIIAFIAAVFAAIGFKISSKFKAIINKKSGKHF